MVNSMTVILKTKHKPTIKIRKIKLQKNQRKPKCENSQFGTALQFPYENALLSELQYVS